MEIKPSLLNASSFLINTNIGRKPFSKTLLVGYGDPEREDRGIAWHIFLELARSLNRTIPVEPREGFYSSGFPADMIFVPQLVPNLAGRLAEYERACFITAHTDPEADLIIWDDVSAEAGIPTSSQSIDPSACIASVKELFGRAPQAAHLSIRTFATNRSRFLSEPTARLLPEITGQLLDWLAQGKAR